MAGEKSGDFRADLLSVLKSLIDGMPQPHHATRVNALIMGVYEASGLRKDEFTQELRAFVQLLHQSPVEIAITGEKVCDICERPGVLNTAPGGEMLCTRCIMIIKEAKLYSWRADEAGVRPIEIDDKLRDILRRIFGRGP